MGFQLFKILRPLLLYGSTISPLVTPTSNDPQVMDSRSILRYFSLKVGYRERTTLHKFALVAKLLSTPLFVGKSLNFG